LGYTLPDRHGNGVSAGRSIDEIDSHSGRFVSSPRRGGFGSLCTKASAPGAAKPKLYNTAKQKLLEGKQVFSFTQSRFDIFGYCEAAKHYDYTWFEMQHSTLEFRDIEAMIAACRMLAPRS
jgi:hypothetical protein